MAKSPTKRTSFLANGGFEEERFDVPVPVHFKCPICLDVFRDPLICPKEHTFCASCIKLHMAQKKPECPECKLPLKPEDLSPAPRILRNMLAELRISCVNKSLGCTAVVTLDQLSAHEKGCKYTDQPCKYCRKVFPLKQLESHELKCEERCVMCSKDCGLRVYPNKKQVHDCTSALKQQVKDLSDQLEQQRIDFQFRQSRLEEYVRRHEAGDRIPWARLLSEKLVLTSGSDTFRTSKTPRIPVARVFTPQSTEAPKRKVVVPKFTFDPRTKSPNVKLLNDNTTMTAADEDSGGTVLGTVVLAHSGVYYWEVRIEAMWDPSSSDGSIRIGIILGESYDTTTSVLGDDQESIGWWDNIVDGALYKELSTDSKMSQGAHLGVLLDLDAKRLELYIDKVLVSELTELHATSCTPAFYTRTRSDRISLIQNPTPPLDT